MRLSSLPKAVTWTRTGQDSNPRLVASERFTVTQHRSRKVGRCQCQSQISQSTIFSVAKIAELLRSPWRRSRVTIQNQEMIVGKELFLDVDGKQVEMEMTECQLTVSSIGVMQRLERSVDRRL